MNNKDIIIIHGAPGSGKTSVGLELNEQLDYPPYLELDRIRQLHLDPDWKNATLADEEMGFINLMSLTENYLQNGYKNIIISHLRDQQLERFIKKFQDRDYLLVSLIVSDDQILKDRVLCETRDSGFRDYHEAIDRNKKIIQRKILTCEYRLDNTDLNIKQTAQAIIESLLKLS